MDVVLLVTVMITVVFVGLPSFFDQLMDDIDA